MGEVVNLTGRRAKNEEFPRRRCHVARPALAADSSCSPRVAALLQVEAADSKGTLETLPDNVGMRQDRLERIIDTMPDETARTQFRRALHELRRQIELVRSVASSI